MNAARRARPISAAALAAASAILASPGVRAERLPFTHFASEQGLTSHHVSCALEDRRGFVWFGTAEGFFRFDGHRFRGFGRGHGMEELLVASLLEDHDGALLVGGLGAVYRFHPGAGGSLRKILDTAPGVRAYLLRDRRGAVWAGADHLYRLERKDGEPVFRRAIAFPSVSEGRISALAEGRDGGLWIGARGVHHLSSDARLTRLSMPPELQSVSSLAVDPEGRLWVATWGGLCRTDREASSGDPAPACRSVAAGSGFSFAGLRLTGRRGGGVWAGNESVLVEVGSDGRLLRGITGAQGLPATGGYPLLLDGNGDLWIEGRRGVARLAAIGLISFGEAEGLEQTRISSIFRSRSGELIVVGSRHVLHRLEGSRFIAVRPNVPAITIPGWGGYQFDLQDHEGNWWIPTGEGKIFRFGRVRRLEDLAGAKPRGVYSRADGLPANDVFRLFEDSRGDIWISTLWHPPPSGPGKRPTLVRWERSTGRFHAYGEAQGVSEVTAPTAFAEMPDGTLWIGFSEGGEVYRCRGGVIQRLGAPGGNFAGGHVTAFHLDRRGRLWIATLTGICRVEDPDVGEPVCERILARNGIAGEAVTGIAEDSRGRIYLGTNRGVDVLEVDRVIRHLDRADGLPHPSVNVMYQDPDGTIWFGTQDGVARLDPALEIKASEPPRVLIDGLRVAGVHRAISVLGETAIRSLTIPPHERRLQVDYIGLSRTPGEATRFQYRLDPAEAWSEPTADRSLLLPNLAPGRYRLEVRAVNEAGVSPEPAVVSFRVLAPVWMRLWFAGLVAALLAASAYGAYRLRVAHLLALERQRMRIALDLHDDLGSGLGSIGVLADLAADDGVEAPRRRELLDQVACTASELGASMGEIVGSLRPGSETLESLARRLAGRGRRLFPDGGPVLQTSFPSSWPVTRLSLPVRHNLAMIGLEALHNAARHSGANSVRLDLREEEGRWRLSVSDNGRGLEAAGGPTAREGPGMGLAGMRRRAGEIGAELRVESREGEGTTVTVLFDPRVGGKARLR